MKSLILVVISLTFSAGPPWETNFERAQAEAKKSHKQIFLNFSGSDWCAPCIKLKRDVFETEEFNTYASENLILIRADFPRLKKNQLGATQRVHNEKLAEKYNPTGKFPYSLLFEIQILLK